MILQSGNTYLLGEYHNYLIGGNKTNAFAIGNIGSKDDFFLVAAEPTEENGYPQITGNILDSEGNQLFFLVKNVLIVNPGKCSKVMGSHIGYEIHDTAGQPVIKVETKFDDESESYVTTIGAKLYNKSRELVFEAKLGTEKDETVSNCNLVMGFSNGNFGFSNASEDDLEMLRIVFSSNGRIYERIKGEISGETIDLSGKLLQEADIHDCEVNISSGDFKVIGTVKLEHNRHST